MKWWCETMSNKSRSVNDIAWASLFDKYDILEQIRQTGVFEISAAQIKEIREPRLMVKFDHSVNLPNIFSENNLAILPITRGNYIISSFKAYHTFEDTPSPMIKLTLPPHLQSLEENHIPSEAIALNCATAAGIMADFLDDEYLVPTVSGRMGSGQFSFNITNSMNRSTFYLSVNNAQIEIDAAYEGINGLALIEAKRDLSEDFLIRQLYYPYRVWKDKITKPVRPIFFVYSNGIFHLYEYVFQEPHNYNSLTLVNRKKYTIEDTAITVADIESILTSTRVLREPNISFPQADSFARIINLCELLGERELSRDEVTSSYAFNERQTNYYTDAARYLGLLEKRKENTMPYYSLTRKGRTILCQSFKKRQLSYVDCILSHQVFNAVLRQYFATGNMPVADKIINIMQNSGIYGIESESTFERRSSTVRSWVYWIINLINE